MPATMFYDQDADLGPVRGKTITSSSAMAARSYALTRPEVSCRSSSVGANSLQAWNCWRIKMDKTCFPPPEAALEETSSLPVHDPTGVITLSALRRQASGLDDTYQLFILVQHLAGDEDAGRSANKGGKEEHLRQYRHVKIHRGRRPLAVCAPVSRHGNGGGFLLKACIQKIDTGTKSWTPLSTRGRAANPVPTKQSLSLQRRVRFNQQLDFRSMDGMEFHQQSIIQKKCTN